jgi:hypothetical protein
MGNRFVHQIYGGGDGSITITLKLNREEIRD